MNAALKTSMNGESRNAPLLDVAIEAKRFGPVPVIRDVALAVPRGEITALVGPSGCGKSTLLRIIAGLDRNYSGRCAVLGEPARLHSGHVGFIFQEPRLLPWLTVADNVGFEAGRHGGRHPRVRELLAAIGLAEFADAWPKQLSGGMAQRAAIARGLFAQPELLLLDEPFSAVDAFTRMRLQDLLLRLAAHHGTTLLLVTHDIDEAVYLADRVLVLAPRPGRLVGEVPIGLPRPRERQSAALAECRQRTLALLDRAASADPADPADITGPVASGAATTQETTSDTTPSPINYYFAV
jgi:sulfonate transport system ATP-binding protein